MVDASKIKVKSFDYDDVTDISDSAEDRKSLELSVGLIDKVDNKLTVDNSPLGISPNSEKSSSSFALTFRMEDDAKDKDSNPDDNEASLFPNHGFDLENLEDDQPAHEDGGEEPATIEVTDDALTVEDGEDGADDIEEIGPLMEILSASQDTPPPHLMPMPIHEAADTDSQEEEEEEDFEDGIPHEEEGHEGELEAPSAEEDTHSPAKEGVRPLGLPQMESPGEEDEEDDDDDDMQVPPPEGSYNPADYEHLDVSQELKELFTFIARYTPQNIELEHRLRPYIPDYIPAVGDIDAFIKIQRPDGENSSLGLTVLDEPSARQSDATVLDLQLRAVAKQTTARSVVVKTVENAEKNGKVIEKWMRDISDLHRAKPPPTVHYAKHMPDIDNLMQEWPGEVEELLKEINLPSAALQVELSQYVDIVCGILDIPIYKSRIQSLHVLFTLFSVFKNSVNFQHLADENIMENDDNSQADQLVL